jgi:PKD repeat protein
MKKVLPIFLLLLSMFSVSLAQRVQTQEPSQGQSVTRCYTDEVDALRRLQNPNLQTQAEFEQWLAVKMLEREQSGVERRETLIVPYIVHVVHGGQAVGTGANLSAAKINAQMQQTNEDFNRLNTDTTNTPAEFLGVAGSLDILFVPALVDPDGNVLAEPGIRRINGQSQFGISAWTTGQTESTLKPATFWDPTRYFNLWTCNLGGGILGYAQFPDASGLPGLAASGGSETTDGLVMAFGTFGSLTNQGSAGQYGYGRTLTHELGHWAGLRHIWGDGGCGVDDFCNDTPRAGAPNYSGSPCTFPGPNSCLTNPPSATDLPDMFQNYMDYSDDRCMNLFTQNQAARMVTIFENAPRRVDLLSSNVWMDPANVVTANFTTNVTGGCTPLTVAFTNTSVAGSEVDPLNSWVWDFDVDNLGGASPATFNGANPPSVVFSNEGTYTVTLTISNGTETDDVTKVITVSTDGIYDHLNGGTIVNVLANTEGGTSGYVGGHNSFGDIAKAEYFEEGAAGLILDYVDYNFAIATAPANRNLTCAIWADNNGVPGAELATKDILISSITTGVGNYTRVDFNDVVLTGPFYAGIKLNLTNGSTVALYTNTNGQTNPATAWEQFGDNSWHNFSEPDISWGWDAALAVKAAIICPEIQVEEPPIADFSANVTSVCAGTAVNFTDLSTNNPTSWIWNFGDGTPNSTEQNPTHTYADGGSYTVTLTASNAEGDDDETKTNYITVQNFPSSFAATASDISTCPGESVNLGMIGTFGATYTWEVNGSQVATGVNTTVAPTATTTYVAICDNGICRVTDEVTITVTPIPATPTISESGATLTASTTTTGVTYQWYLNGSAISGATNATYVTSEDGNYTVVAIKNGCISAQSAITNITSTAVINSFLDQMISIYPNPVSKFLTVNLSGSDLSDLRIMLVDVMGRTLNDFAVTNNSTQIDMNSYAAGVYMIRLSNSKGEFTIRQIVKK